MEWFYSLKFHTRNCIHLKKYYFENHKLLKQHTFSILKKKLLLFRIISLVIIHFITNKTKKRHNIAHFGQLSLILCANKVYISTWKKKTKKFNRSQNYTILIIENEYEAKFPYNSKIWPKFHYNFLRNK